MISVIRFVLLVALAAAQLVAIPVRPWLNPGISDPRNLNSLAAWYDASATSSMLTGAGATITDGGSVALWADKSGNSGVNCLVLNGVTGNYASVPDSAGLSITGDIDLIALVALNDWTPSAAQCSVAKYNATGNQRSYRLEHATSGALAIRWSTDGTGNVLATSTATTGFADGSTNWVRATLDVDNGAGGYTARFYTSSDGSTWVQLGDPVTGVGTTSIFDSTAILEVGSTSAGANDLLNGRVYRAQIYASTDGTDKRLDIDFSTSAKKLANGDTFTCATGQTVTLNSSGATGARIAGERDLFQGTAANRPVYLAYSGTKYGYSAGISGSSWSSTNKSVTGSQTISLDLNLPDYTPGSDLTLIDKLATNDGFQVLLLTTGVVRLRVGDGASVTNVDSTAANTITDGVRGTLGITWTDGVGASFTQNGSALGTSVAAAKTLTNAATGILLNNTVAGRVYGVTVGSVYNFNPTPYTGGTTFVSTTGETWTLNGGATIVTRTGLYGDGVNDFIKMAAANLPQPTTVYSTLAQITWTDFDSIFDGNADNSMRLYQNATTPNIRIRAGAVSSENATLPLKTSACVTTVFNSTASQVRVNRGTAVTGDAGTTAANGFTLGSGFSGGNPSNIFVSEVAIYAAAHDTATQDSVALYEIIKWRIVE